jgi:hypothetical protein
MVRDSINFLFILFSFISATVYSQSKISVTTSSGLILDCSNSKSFPAACIDNKGNKYLVEASEMYASAIQLTKDGELSMAMMIKEVVSDGQIIFKTSVDTRLLPIPVEKKVGQNLNSPQGDYRSDYISSERIANNLEFITESTTDPYALELIKEMTLVNNVRVTQLDKIINHKVIEAEIDEGVRGSCQKIDQIGVFTCNIYKCSNPIDGYLIDNNLGTSTIFQLDSNNKFTNILTPKKIWSPVEKKKPLVVPMARPEEDSYGLPFTDDPKQLDLARQKIRLQNQKFTTQNQREIPNLNKGNLEVTKLLRDPIYRSMLTSMIKSCDPQQVSGLLKGLSSLRQSIADAEMVQIVEVTNNMLTSRLINPDVIPENTCRDGNTWFRDSSYEHSRNILASSAPKTIDFDTAKRLFHEAQAMQDIAWKYKQDGCYARAHLMARRFEQQGINVDKVWIKGNLHVPETNISWNFHVAPIVYVERDNGQVERMVIDPSLTDGPVSVDEWSATMQKGVLGNTIETTFPFPQNVAALERTAISFSNSDPYLPYDKINMTEEDKRNESEKTMMRYLGF